jgi:hypothetical protein
MRLKSVTRNTIATSLLLLIQLNVFLVWDGGIVKDGKRCLMLPWPPPGVNKRSPNKNHLVRKGHGALLFLAKLGVDFTMK